VRAETALLIPDAVPAQCVATEPITAVVSGATVMPSLPKHYDAQQEGRPVVGPSVETDKGHQQEPSPIGEGPMISSRRAMAVCQTARQPESPVSSRAKGMSAKPASD